MSNVDSFVHVSTLVSAREASRILGIQLTTLYAYVSRGFLTSHAAEKHRARRYDRDEVMRLKARHDARSGHAPAAAAALAWGAPVLDSSITELSDAGPRYRGHLATDLVESGATFEDVAELLMTGALPDAVAPFRVGKESKLLRSVEGPGLPDALSRLSALVAILAVADEARFPLARDAEIARGRTILAETPWIVAPRAWSSVRARLVRSPRRLAHVLCEVLALEPSPRRIALVDAILILCADHELNVSAFAARVVTSAGADLYAALAAAAGALSGPLHGGATARAEALAAEVGSPREAARVVASRARRGEIVPGVGHPIYPKGDPRGKALLAMAKREAPRDPTVRRVDAIVTAAHDHLGAHPTIDLGLVAATAALGAPRGTAPALFAIGRVAGWIAHVLEQRQGTAMLRPRARYVGPAPLMTRVPFAIEAPAARKKQART